MMNKQKQQAIIKYFIILIICIFSVILAAIIKDLFPLTAFALFALVD